MNTKWKEHLDLRTDNNLNNIGAGICRVRAANCQTLFARLMIDNKGRVLVNIDGLIHASCPDGASALDVCQSHYNLTQSKVKL